MARPKRDGLNYFPLDVDFFTDRKIKVLKSNYGTQGIAIYLYLLCEVYKVGFYTTVDEDFIDIIADDLNMSADTINKVMKFLLVRSLFNDTLYQSDKVLTSVGIQKRFQEAVKVKALKKPVEVNEFWLLSKKETQSFIKIQEGKSYSEINAGYSKINVDYSEINTGYSEINAINKIRVKESKVKESKTDKITKTTRLTETTLARKQAIEFIAPTLQEITDYCKERNNGIDPKTFYDYFTVGQWVDSKGNRVKNWRQKMITWEKQDGKNKTSQTESFDEIMGDILYG